MSDTRVAAGVRRAVLVAGLSLASFAAFAQAERASAALDQQDCDGAVDALNRGMNDGEARSMFMVGQMFESGVCLRADLARAAGLYERAASLGDVASARSLALMEARGAGVPQSYVKAGYWFAVARGVNPAGDAETAFAAPDAVARTYVEAVHDYAEDTMVYPRQAATQGVKARIVMRFDPRDGSVVVVSSVDDQGSAINHLGPNKHLFERALSTSYLLALKAMPKPELPATGDFATDHAMQFSQYRKSGDGPYAPQGLRR